MAYTKQTWTVGEIITKEKLDYIETGLASILKGDTVNIDNKKYEVNNDFSTSILFESLIQDNSIGE